MINTPFRVSGRGRRFSLFYPRGPSFDFCFIAAAVDCRCVWAFRWKALFIRAREVIVYRRRFGLGKANDTAKRRLSVIFYFADGRGRMR